PTAALTRRHCLAGHEACLDLVARVLALAGQTPYAGGIPVEFDDLLRIGAGALMEIVHVLRDHAVEQAQLLQSDQRPVRGVRLGVANGRVELAAHRPVAATRVVRPHEVRKREIVRIVSSPEPRGTPEVRDPGLGRDTGPGEGYDSPSCREK